MSLTRIKPTGVNNTAQFSMANLSIAGNVDAGNLKTDNLLYANGVAWDLQQAAGASSQIQFNNNNNFDASANLTFNKSTKTLTTDTVVANVTGNVTGNTTGTHTGPSVGDVTGNLTGNVTGTLLTASQTHITSVGTLTSLAVTNDATVGGNVSITGNLTVSGTSTIVNSTVVEIADVTLVLAKNASTSVQANGGGIQINGAGANFTYWSAPNAFVSSHQLRADGAQLSNINASNIASGTIPSNILGNSTVYVGTTGIAANRASGAQSLTGITSIDGYATTVSINAQPNITSVGTLTGLNSNGEVIVGNLATGGTRMRLVESGGSSYIQSGNGVNGSANTVIFSPWYSATATMAIDLTNRRIGIKKSAPTVELDVAGAGVFTGNVTAGNIAGGNLVSATYLTGTLTTATQPNITSVGTLLDTTLGSSNSFSGGNLVSATYLSGTLTTATQPNITSVGTLSSLAVSGSGSITGANLISANYVTSLTTMSANAINVSGTFTSGSAQEIIVASGAASASTITYNLSSGASFYHSSVTNGAHWTANITNVPTTDNRSTVFTIIVVQGATPYIPNTLQVNGVTQSLRWSNGTTPEGKANSVDIFSFALLRSGAAWAQVLGSYTSYT